MSSDATSFDEFDEARILIGDLLVELEIIALLLGDRNVATAPGSDSTGFATLDRRVELVEQILFRIWMRANSLAEPA